MNKIHNNTSLIEDNATLIFPINTNTKNNLRTLYNVYYLKILISIKHTDTTNGFLHKAYECEL